MLTLKHTVVLSLRNHVTSFGKLSIIERKETQVRWDLGSDPINCR
ncbi:hypothetical protein POPTR_004G188950v4 [Populus trichocarpa]|uniref:Uncharacterized protein n=1 Tax=Populus trichocarpa TaxID=3694 RepID=A0ACC0T5F0_POPTR|nr:hypothetical protein POPTR_004G188950v4 [Populus trichocarpa]